MDKKNAVEAAPIVQHALTALMKSVPSTGRIGSQLRMAANKLAVDAEELLIEDAIGPPLAYCFELARQLGITQGQLAYVRTKMLAERPKLLGPVLIRNAIVYLCLSYEGMVISTMLFTSRAQIDALQASMNSIFAVVEEVAADEMDQMTYQGLLALHAAITYALTQTARPLARMLKFMFAAPMPTLITAMRLYSDAGRADELRAENGVVHPAFMRRSGVALSK